MHLLYNLSVKMFNNEDLNRNSNIQRISDFDLKLGRKLQRNRGMSNSNAIIKYSDNEYNFSDFH